MDGDSAAAVVQLCQELDVLLPLHHTIHGETAKVIHPCRCEQGMELVDGEVRTKVTVMTVGLDKFLACGKWKLATTRWAER